MVVAEVDDVVPDGDVDVVDDVVDGGLALEPEGETVVELVVELSVALGVVVVVVEDDDAGGVGGTTTVVEDVLGGVEVVDDGGGCCWQAPSASSTLAATAG